MPTARVAPSITSGKPHDRVEIWGRRIGRGIGLVLAVLLLANLFTHWLF